MTTPIVFLDTDRLTRECSYCGAAFTLVNARGELDALPPRTVIREIGGYERVLERHHDRAGSGTSGWWFGAGMVPAKAVGLPAKILWVPDA